MGMAVGKEQDFNVEVGFLIPLVKIKVASCLYTVFGWALWAAWSFNK